MLHEFAADEPTPPPADPDDQEYEDFLLSVVTRIASILIDSDDDDPDPESSPQ